MISVPNFQLTHMKDQHERTSIIDSSGQFLGGKEGNLLFCVTNVFQLRHRLWTTGKNTSDFAFTIKLTDVAWLLRSMQSTRSLRRSLAKLPKRLGGSKTARPSINLVTSVRGDYINQLGSRWDRILPKDYRSSTTVAKHQRKHARRASLMPKCCTSLGSPIGQLTDNIWLTNWLASWPAEWVSHWFFCFVSRIEA